MKHFRGNPPRGRRFGQTSTTSTSSGTATANAAAANFNPASAAQAQAAAIMAQIAAGGSPASSSPVSSSAPYTANASSNAVLQQLSNLQVQIASMSAANTTKKAQLDQAEASLRQGTVPVRGPQDVKANLRNGLPEWMVPGNLGEINSIIWPFWFTNITPALPAATGGTQSQATASVTITQEAAFIITSFTKAIFTYDPITGFATYLDPSNIPGGAGLSPGLTMTLVDAQSSRVFMSKPIQLDTVGYSVFPNALPTPLMFLPNSIIQTQLFNSSASNNYVPWITYFGVRCRIEDAQRIMSLITG